MTFLELAKARYSVRKFKNDRVEAAKLAAILEAGRVAPTACNNQPQRIYVIKSEETRKKLAEVCRYTFDAPVILVIGYDKERDWKNRRMPGYGSGETDAAIVCTHMMLEAWEQGIGSCWVGAFAANAVEEALSLPENIRVTAMLPLGYAADDAEPAAFHGSYRDFDDTVTVI
ncbi:MAG: nitroreductase family protein [Clostridia bacterium]|nr:nitroreductase family protein [Clostridia bacterium]